MKWQHSIQSISLCLAIVFMASCGTVQNPPTEAKPQPPVPEPVFSALPQGTEVLSTRTFSSSKNTSYKIEVVKDDREEEMRALPARERDVAVAPSVVAALGDNFQGTARKAAKLSFATAPVETFADVQLLINTLPSHSAMVHHTPPITVLANSNRVAEEKRNVKVRAFLYAASREDDNDFHLIMGRAPNASPAVYFTMELSGLPPANSAAFTRLMAAREAFKTFFGSNLPGTSYDFYTPPIPVEVEGSLFFDMSHATGGRPGPATLRPKMPVVWEMHPINRIVFEP